MTAKTRKLFEVNKYEHVTGQNVCDAVLPLPAKVMCQD